jgi:hypothetical protein
MPSSPAAATSMLFVADGHVGDDPQAFLARVQHVGVDPVSEQRHDRVTLGRMRAQLRVRVGSVVGVWPDDLLIAKRFQPAVGQTASHEDARHAD